MLLILKDTKINLTMFVSFSIYTKALPIISNYVNSTQRDKRRHFSVCPFYVNSWIIHILYIPSITRFHVFSFIELLYLYSVLKSLSVAYRLEAFCYNWEALPVQKGGVRTVLDILQFVILNIVDPLIISIMANYFYDSLKQR